MAGVFRRFGILPLLLAGHNPIEGGVARESICLEEPPKVTLLIKVIWTCFVFFHFCCKKLCPVAVQQLGEVAGGSSSPFVFHNSSKPHASPRRGHRAQRAPLQNGRGFSSSGRCPNPKNIGRILKAIPIPKRWPKKP